MYTVEVEVLWSLDWGENASDWEGTEKEGRKE